MLRHHPIRDSSRDHCETLETLNPENQPNSADRQTRSEIAHRRIAEPLLTLKEAADYLRLTPSAMYTQRHRGDRQGATWDPRRQEDPRPTIRHQPFLDVTAGAGLVGPAGFEPATDGL